MVKGNKRASFESNDTKYVGLTVLKPAAFNPSRQDLNKMFGRDDSETDKPLNYIDKDKEDNDRVKCAFWLFDAEKKKYFIYDFFISKKNAISKDGNKTQLINNVSQTTWVPFIKKMVKNQEVNTDKPDYDVAPAFFKHFIDKEDKVIGDKTVRVGLSGEGQLATLLETWIGVDTRTVNAELTVDVKKILKGNYEEIRSLIDSDYATEFVALVGVETDSDDPDKKYQKVYGDMFLPKTFMGNIKKMKFSSDWSKKKWKKFEDKILSDRGPKFFVELCALKEYDEREDVAAGEREESRNDKTSSEY